jgi:hypothetical protein
LKNFGPLVSLNVSHKNVACEVSMMAIIVSLLIAVFFGEARASAVENDKKRISSSVVTRLDSLIKSQGLRFDVSTLVFVPIYEFGCGKCVKSHQWLRDVQAECPTGDYAIVYYTPGVGAKKLRHIVDAGLLSDTGAVPDKARFIERLAGSSSGAIKVLVINGSYSSLIEPKKSALCEVLKMLQHP